MYADILWILFSFVAKKINIALSHDQYALVAFCYHSVWKLACNSLLHSALPVVEAEKQLSLLPLVFRVQRIFESF